MQYAELEKIAYTVVMASRKLRHYFEAFKVRVTSDRGLGELFRNPEASVRIAKWAAKLSGCRRFDPGGSLDRRVNCRCVSQPRWVGARWNTRGKKEGTAARAILCPGWMRLQ